MPYRIWITFLWVGSIVAIVGCSGKSPPAEPGPTVSAPAAAPAAGTTSAVPPPGGTAPAVAPPPAVANTVDPSKPETKWIGTIPYDVFYDQPLVVASDATPIGGGPASVSPTPGDVVMDKPAVGPTTPAEAPAAAGSKTDWAKVMSLELAQEAVKVARTEVNASLQGVPKYNMGLESIRMNSALIGMLAVIVAEHPEAANWKDKAKFIRDLCYKIQGTATEKGSEKFKETQALFEQITGILDGGKPPEMESADSVPYSESADRADMMKIIDLSMNDLKSNIGDSKRMKERAPEVTRQLAILQAMGVMMSDLSYDQADNPEYQGFTKNFVDGAAAGVEAVKSDKFEDFQGALSKMNTSCSECHPKFRGGDSN
jgi:hypothetical protein